MHYNIEWGWSPSIKRMLCYCGVIVVYWCFDVNDVKTPQNLYWRSWKCGELLQVSKLLLMSCSNVHNIYPSRLTGSGDGKGHGVTDEFHCSTHDFGSLGDDCNLDISHNLSYCNWVQWFKVLHCVHVWLEVIVS
jgi:hypothetical protein